MTDSLARAREQVNELDLVKLVLCAHQTTYAKFHNGEGRGVIEADTMAMGYASVELAKALATLLATAVREARVQEAEWWHNVPSDHDCSMFPERESCRRLRSLKEGQGI